MKQTDLAKVLGVSGASISGYELGDISPPLEALVRISTLSDTSLEWLAFGLAPGLDKEEQSLVDMYRELDPGRQKRILLEVTDYFQLLKKCDR